MNGDKMVTRSMLAPRSRLSLLAVLAVLVAVTPTGPVAAETQADSAKQIIEKLVRYRNTDFYKRLLLTAALRNDQKLQPPCTDVKPGDRRLIAVVRPVAFADGVDEPATGVWLERVTLQRCGSVAYRNIIFYIKPGEGIRARAALPGLTRADLQLQSDTTAALLASAKAGNPSCKSTAIVDTEVVKHPPQRGDPWVERWSVYDCAETAAYDITFTPDAQGRATYSFDPKPN